MSYRRSQKRQSSINLFCYYFRVISRAPGLKIVVETLISSLKPIGNIVLIAATFFIIFGILGVQVKICKAITVTSTSNMCGGAVASWLVCSTPDPAVGTGNIVFLGFLSPDT